MRELLFAKVAARFEIEIFSLSYCSSVKMFTVGLRMNFIISLLLYYLLLCVCCSVSYYLYLPSIHIIVIIIRITICCLYFN